MILVRNHPQLLSGNNFWLVIVICLLISSCSPKVVRNPNQQTKDKAPQQQIAQPVKKFTTAQISVLVPFKLNQFNLATATKAQIEKADMAIDFYQGIQLGIDSAAALGLNFKVNIFDTQDDNVQLGLLQKKDELKNSNLIIGPVFPQGIKYMTNFSIANDLPLVSPLSAAKPSDFNNPNLISIVNNIDHHAIKMVDYIAAKYRKENTVVVLINPKKAADEQFAVPIKNHFKNKYPAYLLQEFSSAAVFETKMMKDKQYVVIVCSSDLRFVAPSIDKLYKLKNLKTGGYEIDLFGHPNWIKQQYNVAQLQGLNTVISTSYHIDYKRAAIVEFVKKYRKEFQFEPSEYAFKGFDIGFYFSRLLARYGEKYLDYLTKEKYRGLHNDFEFEFNPKYGYTNKELMLLKYKNLTLINVD